MLFFKKIGLSVAGLFLLVISQNVAAVASSSSYQLGHAAFDGGGGIGFSASYSLNASAIGTSLHSPSSGSTNLAVIPGGQLVDDDGDGLDNAIEILIFDTKADDADTDEDLLSDGEELITVLTDPTLFDTDGDTFGDGEEVANGWNPLDALDPGIIENVPLPGWALLATAMMLVAGFHRRAANCLRK